MSHVNCQFDRKKKKKESPRNKSLGMPVKDYLDSISCGGKTYSLTGAIAGILSCIKEERQPAVLLIL